MRSITITTYDDGRIDFNTGNLHAQEILGMLAFAEQCCRFRINETLLDERREREVPSARTPEEGKNG